VLIGGALQAELGEKSARRKNEDPRSQGDPLLVRFANHPLNDPASLFKSDGATVSEGSWPRSGRVPDRDIFGRHHYGMRAGKAYQGSQSNQARALLRSECGTD